uniref:Uncharacterized protein n=1 Tax=Ditylenchus dipsaci TaxID=166011 RepID=A0A915EPD8_9BILA
MEIFSEPNDVLKQALLKSSEWLLTFLQDALAECKSGDSAPYITQLSRLSRVQFSSFQSCSRRNRKNLQDMVDSQIVTCSDTTNLVFPSSLRALSRQKFQLFSNLFLRGEHSSKLFNRPELYVTTKSSNDKRLELVLRALRHKVTPVASMEIFETCCSWPSHWVVVYLCCLNKSERDAIFSTCTDEAEVEEMISKPMSPVAPLLDALLSNDGIFATAFYQSEVVQLYTTYSFSAFDGCLSMFLQCDIALSLPSLWLSVPGELMDCMLGGGSKHGNKLANETITLLQSAGAFSGFESKHEKLQELLSKVSKDATPSALSLGCIVDQIFNDSTLPLSSSDLNEADAVKVPTVTIIRGGVMQSFSTPPSSTANTARMKKSVESVKALATKTSVNRTSVVTASTVYATPKSATSSGLLTSRDTGHMRKWVSINSDKKNFESILSLMRLKELRNRLLIRQVFSPARVFIKFRWLRQAESIVQSRKRLHLPAKDGIVTEKDASAHCKNWTNHRRKVVEYSCCFIFSCGEKNKLNSVLAPVLRTPFMPELVENEETIVQLCRNLAPGSNSTLKRHFISSLLQLLKLLSSIQMMHCDNGESARSESRVGQNRLILRPYQKQLEILKTALAWVDDPSVVSSRNLLSR